jgi:predicted AlkP superfamily pyrophosphatase or phosphodiesterase
MSNKVIFIVLDGLNNTVAQQCLGYCNALIESKQASYYTITSELPSLSRPLYECLLTGVRPVDSGIVSNHISRLSKETSIFKLATKSGLTTAAAAYHWVSELYNISPYKPVRDRITNDPSLPIQHGLFYHADHYPDDHLFIDAEALRYQYDPDFLLIHPMNIDDAGHKFGLDSPEYRNTARRADMILSHFIPDWIDAGYQLIITSDHGMNNDKTHGGTLAEERQVPLYLLGSEFSHISAKDLTSPVAQTQLCGLICELLKLVNHDKPYSQELLKRG